MKKLKDYFQKRKQQSKKKAEASAKKIVLEELFYDFNRSRSEVYKLNFFRGIFFGFGSALGGTLLVALLLTVLTLLVDLPGGIGDFIQYIVDTVQTSQSE